MKTTYEKVAALSMAFPKIKKIKGLSVSTVVNLVKLGESLSEAMKELAEAGKLIQADFTKGEDGNFSPEDAAAMNERANALGKEEVSLPDYGIVIPESTLSDRSVEDISAILIGDAVISIK